MPSKIEKALHTVQEDLSYQATRTGALMAGKIGIAEMPVIASALPGAALGMLSMLGMPADATIANAAGATVKQVVEYLVVPMVATLSGSLVQMDYRHKRERLRDEYREEIAAAHQMDGLKPAHVAISHMEELAKGNMQKGIRANPTLKAELKRLANERNFGVVASAAASVGAYFAVHALLGGLHLENITAASSITQGLIEVGNVAAHALAGFAAYIGIRTPIHAIGDAVLGLDAETVQDRIVDIKRQRGRGKLVSQEQVLQVYLQAHPEINDQVADSYGSKFEDLSRALKREVIAALSKEVELPRMTADINEGRVKPEELAFAAYGQQSGVAPKLPKREPSKATLLGRVWNAVCSLCGAQSSPEEQQACAALAEAAMAQEAQAKPAPVHHHHHHAHAEPARSFASRVASGAPEGLSHVQRVTQRAESGPALGA